MRPRYPRLELTEEDMRMMSQIELARCTKSELHALLNIIVSELPRLAEGSAELRAAHANLQLIRRLIARPEFRLR
jgi:hypothetical protein